METEDVIIRNSPSNAPDENIKTEEDEGEEKDNNEAEAACPLFMENLPRDFLSNPQLAAIASLMDSDNENKNDNDDCTPCDSCHSKHQCEDDKNDVDDNDTVITTNRRIDKITETTSSSRTDNKPSRQFPLVGMVIGGGKVRRMHRAYSQRNRHTSNAAPYPPQRQMKIQDNRKMKASIGEAQLFLNMWKL